MLNPVIRNIPLLQNLPKSKHHLNNYTTVSQTQQENFNKEIFKQNLEGAVITMLLIIVVLLCVAIYEKYQKD